MRNRQTTPGGINYKHITSLIYNKDLELNAEVHVVTTFSVDAQVLGIHRVSGWTTVLSILTYESVRPYRGSL